MTRCKKLIRLWDQIEDRVRMLKWVQWELLGPPLSEEITRLEALCRFDQATKTTLRKWRKFEAQKSPRDIAAILEKYRQDWETLNGLLSEVLEQHQKAPSQAAANPDMGKGDLN